MKEPVPENDQDSEEYLNDVDFRAFGHHFPAYPSGLAEDLISLEREGAIYAHFADSAKGPTSDGKWSFQYYRVALTPPEIFQYVEACVAFQEFGLAMMHGADFEAGLNAVSNREIAERVRRYRDAEVRGCHASFYPSGMDELLCGNRRDRYTLLPGSGEGRDNYAQVMQISNRFEQAVRILGVRQRGRPPLAMENEYDVQDLLYAVLRSIFEDAKREEWTPQRAGSAKRIDIVIGSVGTVVEVKFVRDAAHSRTGADELRVDFECYHDRPECRRLVAFVWDPLGLIGDPVQFGADLSGLRQKNDHSFQVEVMVR